MSDYIDGLVQERRNYSALAMELRLSYINPSIYAQDFVLFVLMRLYFDFWWVQAIRLPNKWNTLHDMAKIDPSVNRVCISCDASKSRMSD